MKMLWKVVGNICWNEQTWKTCTLAVLSWLLTYSFFNTCDSLAKNVKKYSLKYLFFNFFHCFPKNCFLFLAYVHKKRRTLCWFQICEKKIKNGCPQKNFHRKLLSNNLEMDKSLLFHTSLVWNFLVTTFSRLFFNDFSNLYFFTLLWSVTFWLQLFRVFSQRFHKSA